MAEIDETLEQRETYGTAPGWSATERAVVSGEQPVVAPASQAQPESPPEDAGAASSAAESGGEPQEPSGTAPPPPSQAPARKPWNLPPEERWEELRRERDEARQLAREAVAARPAPPAPVAQPQTDPWEGLINHPDPATARFYQQQKSLVEHAVQQGRQQALQELQPVLYKLQKGQTEIGLKEFRKENPDIQPGSEEERLVIAYLEGRVDGVQHPLESARNNAVIKRLEAENRALKAKQATMPQKRQAMNAEPTAGIPATAGLPGRPGSWQERVGAVIDQGGDWREIGNAVFGKARRKP